MSWRKWVGLENNLDLLDERESEELIDEVIDEVLKEETSKNLPSIRETLVPVDQKLVPQELIEMVPLIGDVVAKYPFYKETDEQGDYIPEAVEQNMLSEGKLAGDLYVLSKAFNLTTLGKGALDELMCLTPKMKEYLGIDDGKSKTIELEGRRVSSGNNKTTKSRNKKAKKTSKTTRKTKSVAKSRTRRKGRTKVG